MNISKLNSTSKNLRDLDTDVERAQYLQDMLIDRATYDDDTDDKEYKALRRYFLDDPETREPIPDFVRTKRNLSHFWSFISSKFGSYKPRRQFIWDGFSPLLDYLEQNTQSPHTDSVSVALDVLSSEYVNRKWSKAIKRVQNDPEGAITLSRTLLESVLKHLSDEMNIKYGDNPSINQLYKPVANELNLSPEQHNEKIFKQILGSCSGVASGLGELRNKLSDAHGKGSKSYSPAPRHAELATNIAGAMCMFLVKTYNASEN